MWYYAVNGQTLGPISEADLDAQIRDGALSADTYVWRDGMADWLPYKNCRASADSGFNCPEGSAPDAFSGPMQAAALRQGASLRLESGSSWAMLAIMLIAMFGFIGVLSSRPRIADRPLGLMVEDDDDPDAFAASARLRRGTLTVRNSGGMDWPETSITFKSADAVYTYQVASLECGELLEIPLNKFTASNGSAYESKGAVSEPSKFELNVKGHGTTTLELSRGGR